MDQIIGKELHMRQYFHFSNRYESFQTCKESGFATTTITMTIIIIMTTITKIIIIITLPPPSPK